MFSKIHFLNVLAFLLLTQTVFHYSGSQVTKYGIYITEIVFIFITIFSVLQKGGEKYGFLSYVFLLILTFIPNLILNYNFNYNIDEIVKIFGSVFIFIATFNLSNVSLIFITRKEQFSVYIISIIPFIVYLADSLLGFQRGVNEMSIFSNSNTYIFFSICCVWLMMVFKIPRKFIWIYFVLNFMITSTLGALMAVVLAVLFYYRMKIFKFHYLLGFLTLSLVVLYLVLTSDLYLFERLRGSGDVFYTLYKNYSLSEFSDVSYGQAMALSGSEDGSNVSFLFRIKIWTESIIYFFNQHFIHILFGLGFGSVPKINSYGLVAHNDYLSWLIETGVVGSMVIIYGVWFGFKKLKATEYIIPYLSILIYFISENLYFNFFGDMIFSFCLALSLKQVGFNLFFKQEILKTKHENFTD